MADAGVSPRMRLIEQELETQWLGRPTTILAEVDSTNRWLKRQFMTGWAAHGAAVWSDAQTEGRGRLGRAWYSPAGANIYTSILLCPPRQRLSGVLSLVAGIAVVHAVRRHTGLDARIKWPNDAVIAGRKFCGILVEAGVEPEPWVIVGIGVNVGGPIDPAFAHAVSLAEALGGHLVREDLWLDLMQSLEEAYDQWLNHGDQWVIQAWTSVNATMGQRVRVNRPGHDPWEGIAERIDSDGGLWLRQGTRLKKVIAGEVSIRLADGRYAPDSF